MTDEKKPRATKTARNPESIFKGALQLPLEERVRLLKELKDSINAEVAEKEKVALYAKEIANGS